MSNSRKKIFAIGLIIGLVALGCGQRVQSSAEAIDLAKAKATVEEQAKFLVQQANSFINGDQFDEAIKTARYVLSNLDSNSTAAQDIIAKAEAELKKIAQAKLDEAKSKLGNFGK